MWVGLAGTVHAQQSDEDRARAHFSAGSSYFDQGRYAEAAGQWEDAYRLAAHAELLLNIATAYERDGDLERAVAALERYLALDDLPDRVTVQTRLDQVQARLEGARSGEAGADVQGAEEAEDRGDGSVARAPHLGTDDREDTSAAAGGGSGVLPIVGLIALGVGAVVGGVSLVTGIAANDKRSELAGECPSMVCGPSLRDDVNGAQSLATASTATTFVALGLGLLGGVLVVVGVLGDAGGGTSDDRTTVALGPGPGDAGLLLTVRH